MLIFTDAPAPNEMDLCLVLQFPDAQGGEWFGYLTQEGKVALDFKGGPFKGKNVSIDTGGCVFN